VLTNGTTRHSEATLDLDLDPRWPYVYMYTGTPGKFIDAREPHLGDGEHRHPTCLHRAPGSRCLAIG